MERYLTEIRRWKEGENILEKRFYIVDNISHMILYINNEKIDESSNIYRDHMKKFH